MEKFLILIIGPQGSGKGTQGKMLAEKLGFIYAEMGPTLKQYAKTSFEDGKKINKFQAKGKLVPDEIVIKAIKYKFQGSKSIILDGVPRNENQAEEIINLAREYDFRILAILIQISDEEAEKRLLSRKICPVDGYEPPYPESLKATTCPKCGTKFIQRTDDNIEVIKKRLSEYHQKTEPMIELLKKNSVKVINIDGSPKVTEVHGKVIEELKKIGIKM